jgi:hypothetical protein
MYRIVNINQSLKMILLTKLNKWKFLVSSVLYNSLHIKTH